MQTVEPDSGMLSAGEKKQGFLSVALPFLLVCAVYLLAIFFANPSGNFPINDDLIYAKAVRSVLETGTLHIIGSNAFDFIPLYTGIGICSLFGFSYELLRATSIAFHLFGSLGLFLCLKEMGLKPRDSALFTSVYTFNPFLVDLSLTFMTDVPALAFTNWIFYVSALAIKRNQLKFWIMAVLALTAAMSVRQTALLFFPAVFLAGILFLKERKDKLSFLASCAIPIVGFVVLSKWMAAHNAFQSATDTYTNAVVGKIISLLNPAKLIEELTKASCYFGSFLLPVTLPVLAIVLRQFPKYKSESLLALGGSALVTVLPLVDLMIGKGKHMPFNQNLFCPPYIGTYSIIGGESTWPDKHIQTLTVVASVAAAICSYLVFFAAAKFAKDRRTNESQKNVWHFFLAFALLIPLGALLVQLQAMGLDRYYTFMLTPLLLVIAELWLAISPGLLAFAVAGCVSLAIAAYSALAVSDNMNFQRGVWQSIAKVEKQGISPRNIDGGPEYNHQFASPDVGKAYVVNDTMKGWPSYLRGTEKTSYYRWWPINGEDYIVSCYFMEDYHPIAETPYWNTLKWKFKTIYILESDKLPEDKRIQIK